MPKSRVDYPSSRRAPEPLLALLREVDPTAELLYMGFGPRSTPEGDELFGPRWCLGSFDPGRPGRHQANRILKGQWQRGMPTGERARFARAVLQGFAPIDVYVQRDPDSTIVEDFREADWRYRTDPEGNFAIVEDAVEGGPRLRRKLALVRDAVDSKALDSHRHHQGRIVSSGSGRYSVGGRRNLFY